jgi:transcriptional regulator with XRE-family HTH domain
MNIPEMIAYNLRRLREKSGMTQDEVAHLYGCAPSYLSQLENAKVSLGKGPAGKLARIYNVTIKEFMRVPPEIGDETLNEIWQSVYEIQQGEQAEVFGKLVKLFQKVNAGELNHKAIEGLLKYIETFLEP